MWAFMVVAFDPLIEIGLQLLDDFAAIPELSASALSAFDQARSYGNRHQLDRFVDFELIHNALPVAGYGACSQANSLSNCPTCFSLG